MTNTQLRNRATLNWLSNASHALDRAAEEAAIARQATLTKPPGSLGRLEELAIWLSARQGKAIPMVAAPSVAVFAGDHGVAKRGVSAFPPEVTGQMVANFAAGGAAICVLSREAGAHFEVVDVGTRLTSHPKGVIVDRIAHGSSDMVEGPALSADELAHALNAGRRAVQRAQQRGADLLVLGEMGIGNTTAASAVSASLLGLCGEALAGPGTGLDPAGVASKALIVDQAIRANGLTLGSDPLDVLAAVGGHELAALTGAYLSAAELGLPVVVDGFICSASALVAARVRPDCAHWMLGSHTSAEPGHQLILAELDMHPVLDLGLRLGEGSGAGALLPILKIACALHGSMATFAEAGVAEA